MTCSNTIIVMNKGFGRFGMNVGFSWLEICPCFQRGCVGGWWGGGGGGEGESCLVEHGLFLLGGC